MLVREVAHFLVETLRGHECVVEVVPRGWGRGVQVPQEFMRGFQGNLDVVAEDATERQQENSCKSANAIRCNDILEGVQKC